MTDLLARLGAWVLGLFASTGRFGIFSGQVLSRLWGAGFGNIIQQIHFIGNYSLLIIGVSGLFVGFVLGLQGYYVLVSYGSEEALGVLVALSLVRELGPVVTALLFAGRRRVQRRLQGAVERRRAGVALGERRVAVHRGGSGRRRHGAGGWYVPPADIRRC